MAVISRIGKRRSIFSTLWRFRGEYLLISPFFLIFAVFGLFPVCYSVFLSFFKWHSTKPWIFQGLYNYGRLLFNDPVFWTSIGNAAYILVANVPLMTLLAVLLAVILNNKAVKFKDFFRITYLLPYVTSALAVSVVFFVVFGDTGGMLNAGLKALGLKGQAWLSSQELSKISIVIMVTWKWVGYNMIIALAGLQSIDQTVYDAAKIDGSGRVRTFFRITLPMLRPVVAFMCIMSTIGTLNMFTEPHILTQGGPGYSSLTPILYMYRNSFKFFKLDYGATIAVLIFIITLIPSMAQVKYMLRKEKES
jgi:ABC-type sugar transport system permease subunit